MFAVKKLTSWTDSAPITWHVFFPIFQRLEVFNGYYDYYSVTLYAWFIAFYNID